MSDKRSNVQPLFIKTVNLAQVTCRQKSLSTQSSAELCSVDSGDVLQHPASVSWFHILFQLSLTEQLLQRNVLQKCSTTLEAVLGKAIYRFQVSFGRLLVRPRKRCWKQPKNTPICFRICVLEQIHASFFHLSATDT